MTIYTHLSKDRNSLKNCSIDHILFYRFRTFQLSIIVLWHIFNYVYLVFHYRNTGGHLGFPSILTYFWKISIMSWDNFLFLLLELFQRIHLHHNLKSNFTLHPYYDNNAVISYSKYQYHRIAMKLPPPTLYSPMKFPPPICPMKFPPPIWYSQIKFPPKHYYYPMKINGPIYYSQIKFPRPIRYSLMNVPPPMWYSQIKFPQTIYYY